MPKHKSHRPSQSFFRSLPYELKQSITSKKYEGAVAATPTQPLKGLLPNGLLPTQPGSPAASTSSKEAEEVNGEGNSTLVETEDIVKQVSVAVVETPVASSSKTISTTHKTGKGTPPYPFVLTNSTAQITSTPLRGSSSSTTTPVTRGTGSERKKRSNGKGKENAYLGHPWDCTGLVDRYDKPSDVPAHLRKYYYQRHLLLSQYDRLPVLLDETGWFSITPQPIAKHIADRCQCDVIVDAFCGVGGNAIQFARTCERVIAIDNDPIRLRLARHNALHYGVADRIEFILADFVQYAKSWRVEDKETIDVVFLSPPWGGPGYMEHNPAESTDKLPSQYSLSSILPVHGRELFELSHRLSPNIAYFLPRNVDVAEVSELARPLSAKDKKRTREWVEIEEEMVGDKVKAVTAYFGGLVSQ